MWNEEYEEDESEDLYKEYDREALVEDDELTPVEAGFMQGYEEAI